MTRGSTFLIALLPLAHFSPSLLPILPLATAFAPNRFHSTTATPAAAAAAAARLQRQSASLRESSTSSGAEPDNYFFASTSNSPSTSTSSTTTSTSTTTTTTRTSTPPKVETTTTTTTTKVNAEDATKTTNEAPTNTSNAVKEEGQQRRVLGSQELLMLPRQYGPGNTRFPQMNHVSCTLLNVTPDVALLKKAIQMVMVQHPLLRARVQGDGEPTRRIDLFQMVRQGDPHPPTFVTTYDEFTADNILTVVECDEDSVETSWKNAFQRDLDDGSWCHPDTGPLWKLELHKSKSNANKECALLFAANHAISDQSSVNRMVDQILRHLVELEEGKQNDAPTEEQEIQSEPMPVSLEESVMGRQQRWNDVQLEGLSFDTIKYVASKAAEGLKSPVILPDQSQDDNKNRNKNPVASALSIMAGRTAGGQDTEQRQSAVAFRSLSKETTAKLIEQCRAHGVSVSFALTAAVTLTASDFVSGSNDNDSSNTSNKRRNYKILQSLDMRRFGAKLDQGNTVACLASSHDLMHGPIPDGAGRALRTNPSAQRQDQFWQLAADGQRQTTDFIANDVGPYQAVRVFDFAMSISDLNNLVHLTAQSKDTKGRAYSAGVTNVGVYERQLGFSTTTTTDRTPMSVQHGRYQVQGVYYATPHVTSGCLYPVSAMTVNGQLQFTVNAVQPMVSAETDAQFADALVELLETVARSSDEVSVEHVETNKSKNTRFPEHALTTAVALVGLAAVLSHAGAWADFFRSVATMKANIADPAAFWAALNFWIFFAVGHPLLQPILALSDVLHGSPGPRVILDGLVPVTFLVGNAIVIAAVTLSKEIRNAVNIAAVAAFFTYVGAGLDGQAGLGDYNLALDDSYKGQIVKGCPAYDEVRQPSMDNFDLQKYQGLWYEHKFHDWTQFKEVYDTSLDIKLTEGGLGWVDDFAVKGPAPDAAKLSWDKSPVANGAHYFLFGRVDPSDPPGILREKGFGVEFPNYIVDVKKDPVTGEYQEAIQFQCLERGGVRVFEGINFMSRNPVMTDEEMAAMHARAEQAGMYPYGASPEQMHTVARRPVDAPEIDNNWQAMWRLIGLDKLLELLTESIEDGGR